jgi:hypothetical protein
MGRLSRNFIIAAALLASCSSIAVGDASDGWLCIADQAVGFVYDKHRKSWAPQDLSTDLKFIVRKPNSGDMDTILRRHLDPTSVSYVVLLIGQSSFPLIICENSPGAENHLMTCESGLLNFSINTRLLRMQFYFGVGYLHQAYEFYREKVDNPDTPSIVIGRCSTL